MIDEMTQKGHGFALFNALFINNNSSRSFILIINGRLALCPCQYQDFGSDE